MSCNKRGTCVLISIRPFEHGSFESPITWEGSMDCSEFKSAGTLDYVLGHLFKKCIELRLRPFHFHVDMETV